MLRTALVLTMVSSSVLNGTPDLSIPKEKESNPVIVSEVASSLPCITQDEQNCVIKVLQIIKAERDLDTKRLSKLENYMAELDAEATEVYKVANVVEMLKKIRILRDFDFARLARVEAFMNSMEKEACEQLAKKMIKK